MTKKIEFTVTVRLSLLSLTNAASQIHTHNQIAGCNTGQHCTTEPSVTSKLNTEISMAAELLYKC